MGTPKGAVAMVQRGDDSGEILEPEIEPAGAERSNNKLLDLSESGKPGAYLHVALMWHPLSAELVCDKLRSCGLRMQNLLSSFDRIHKILKGRGSEYDEEEVDYEESDSDESWTTESAISSEAILSSMCMNGGEEKPFACPVPGCKKRYKNVNGIKYHAKNGHRTQIRVRKPFKCRCGKSYKTAQGLRHHTINFHPPVSAEMIRKMQQ
ncbi:Juxtaposed with another zinc finger protein 1 [Microtus ochrogaster]|uniref:Juxtaposed with another zinc finger protein 1 n=1 Tax=Microtus ochrogaster TaxID=79684 RepID=A0A8J6GGV6_MICOH|nr:Juxtaposed with another zinc finger protein 1 [Microtus ochrogaster]